VSSLRIPFEVRCGDSEEKDLSGLYCRPRCKDQPGFSWFDATANQCRRRPRMAVKAASDRLSISHMKTSSTPTKNESIEIRLVSGDVDAGSVVSWNASSSVSWLRLGQPNGTVDSDSPIGLLAVLFDSTNLTATSSSTPHQAVITVVSRMAVGRDDIFEKGENGENTRELAIAVKAYVNALPYIAPEQAPQPGRTQPTHDEAEVPPHRRVTLQTSGGKVLSSLGKEAIDAGDTLVLTARAFDFKGLAIASPTLDIRIELWKGENGARDRKNITKESMKFVRDNLYYREISSSWLADAGSYTLSITSDDGDPIIYRFAAVEDPLSLYVAIGLASVWGRTLAPALALFPPRVAAGVSDLSVRVCSC
jgi:hypothetical protein